MVIVWTHAGIRIAVMKRCYRLHGGESRYRHTGTAVKRDARIMGSTTVGVGVRSYWGVPDSDLYLHLTCFSFP